jgi:hypothetical protein
VNGERITWSCGWCPTPLPYGDHDEVRHHFLIAHRVTGVESVRYHYPDRDKLEAAVSRG